jgi:uncharacterized protein (TIGR00730 family)
MKVAIFGGASAKPGDQSYQDAQHLGRLLGSRGWTVMTGGYIGIMEAASRGACEAGGHVIGVTCAEIEKYRDTKANQWVMEEWNYTTLRERMYTLIDNCDAAVVMPGGVGTLTELAAMWNEMIVKGKMKRPLILVGQDWQRVISQFFDLFGGYVGAKERDLIQIVPDVDAAFEILK